MKKVYASADAALDGLLKDGMLIAAGGFGLCGIPELLIEAIPVPDPDVRPAEPVPVGEPPSPIAPPSGCRFRTRCPRADQRCSDEIPELRAVAPGQLVACHHPLI